jgi:hypothetical protein
MQPNGCADYLRLFIWSCVWPNTISQWIQQRNSVKFCANHRKHAAETLAMILQAFGDESMSCTQKVKTHQDRKNETGEEQSQELITFFHIKGIVHKEFVLAGQTVNSAYCCDVLW